MATRCLDLRGSSDHSLLDNRAFSLASAGPKNPRQVRHKLRKVNPDFFPVPMSAPYEGAPRHKQAGPSLALSVTEGELVDLYNICGRILHSRNPFSTSDATHQIGSTVDEWLGRLEGLLRWHRIQLVNGALWLVNMPEGGNVHVTTALPSNM
jgi:hypothetical protein